MIERNFSFSSPLYYTSLTSLPKTREEDDDDDDDDDGVNQKNRRVIPFIDTYLHGYSNRTVKLESRTHVYKSILQLSHRADSAACDQDAQPDLIVDGPGTGA